MTTSEIFTAIKDVFMVIAAGIASYVALVGLSTWRRQLTGTTEYELALEVLKAVYKLRDAIGYFRNPLLGVGEEAVALKEAEVETDSDDSRNEYKRKAVVFDRRWRVVNEALSEFEVVSIEAETLFGEEVKNKLETVEQCVRSLYSDIHLYLHNLAVPEAKVKMGQIEKRVFGFGDRDPEDAFHNNFSEKIGDVNKALSPYLKKK